MDWGLNAEHINRVFSRVFNRVFSFKVYNEFIGRVYDTAASAASFGGKSKKSEKKRYKNFFKMIFWIILIVLVGFAQLCRKVCLCCLEKTTCYFTRCSDVVPLSETYMLEINGLIRYRQRQILSDEAFLTLLIGFLDDACLNVPNCW